MDADARRVVIDTLRTVAPEVDPDTLVPTVSFRDQLDIDSVDFLNFVLALEQRLGRAIPQLDYPRLSSLDGCVAYLSGADGVPPSA